MTPLGCREVEALADELALGLVTGSERAAVLTHLSRCSSCRSRVDLAVTTVDALLLVGPETEPSPGFEGRVMERVMEKVASTAHEGRAHHRRGRQRAGFGRWRRSLTVAAACLAAVAILLLGRAWGSHDGGVTSASRIVRQGPMLTPDHRPVGRAVVGADPDTVFVAVPGWAPARSGTPGYRPSEDYRVRLTLRNGHATVLGPVHMDNGVWGTTTSIDGAAVARVALIDAKGNEYCSARLPSSA